MKMIKATLKLALILYICAALSGVYVLSASARITPHDGDESTTLITIEKGDTLWHLCQEHLKDPLRWRELSKYNDFTNPHLIYPGEKLRIPVAMMKEVEEELGAEGEKLKLDLEKATEEAKELQKKVEELGAEGKQLRLDLEKATEEAKKLSDELKSQEVLLKESVAASVDGVTSALTKSLEAHQEAIQKKMNQANRRVNALEKMLTEQNAVIEEAQKKLMAIHQSTEALLKQIEMNQQGIAEIKRLIEDAKGFHEKPSPGKRALVFVTTVAAGIGWFAIKAIGGRK